MRKKLHLVNRCIKCRMTCVYSAEWRASHPTLFDICTVFRTICTRCMIYGMHTLYDIRYVNRWCSYGAL